MIIITSRTTSQLDSHMALVEDNAHESVISAVVTSPAVDMVYWYTEGPIVAVNDKPRDCEQVKSLLHLQRLT